MVGPIRLCEGCGVVVKRTNAGPLRGPPKEMDFLAPTPAKYSGMTAGAMWLHEIKHDGFRVHPIQPAGQRPDLALSLVVEA